MKSLGTALLLLCAVALTAAASSRLMLTHGRLHYTDGQGHCRLWKVPGLDDHNEFFCAVAHCRGYALADCSHNLGNIGTALEMYASDHGEYPAALDRLTPSYLHVIPTCSESRADTYSEAYDGAPMACTLMCVGHGHCWMGTPMNYPQYTSRHGLLPR